MTRHSRYRRISGNSGIINQDFNRAKAVGDRPHGINRLPIITGIKFNSFDAVDCGKVFCRYLGGSIYLSPKRAIRSLLSVRQG